MCQYTSLVGTFKIFDAAKKISGAGFKFSKASADTIASNLKGSKQNNKDKRSHTDEIYSLLKCFSEISSSNYALELI